MCGLFEVVWDGAVAKKAGAANEGTERLSKRAFSRRKEIGILLFRDTDKQHAALIACAIAIYEIAQRQMPYPILWLIRFCEVSCRIRQPR